MIDQFDRIYVISDLHLSAGPGEQAFREGAALAAFIELTRLDPHDRVALVINGDIVDFLADGPNTPAFNTRPERYLQRLAADAELRHVFAALSTFVHDQRERHLVLQLGNHDIELALPSAQQALRDLLLVDDAISWARLHFETSGQGWLCQVGRRLVQVLHGNATDPWNAVDHAGLERASRAAARGDAIDPPVANAGTRMVCHVINPIKERHPFVDLLKPEDQTLMAVLAAVDAQQSVLGLIRAMGELPVSAAGELLGHDGTADDVAGPVSGPELAMTDFVASLALSTGSDHVLRRAELNLEAGRRVRELVADDRRHLRSIGHFARMKRQQWLGAAQSLRGIPERESLRLALAEWAADDRSFDPAHLDAVDRRILDSALPGVDVVIAGHTHLPRIHDGRPIYINTGTWMRVYRMKSSPYLADDTAFKTLFEAIRDSRTLPALDAALPHLDRRQRPVAIVDAEDVRLVSVGDDGRPGPTLTN